MTAHDPVPAIVGRDTELEAIGRWLQGARPALLEIEGEAGIGKTTLWEAGVRAARDAGALVLSCRPVEIETAVSYGALASLLEPALALVADAVPEPRLRALEGALRLREVTSSSLDETAVALGAVSVLRAAAEQQPVVLALEDVQWLDTSSRVALTYAIRKLRTGDDVAVLLTRRLGAGGGALDLTGSDVALGTKALHPGPLSLGALHRVIRGRLGVPLSRPKLVRVHDASRGNPLYALELARVVSGADLREVALAVPASLAEALRTRLEALTAPTRKLLLVVATAGEPRRELLSRLTDAANGWEAELDEAIRHGVLALVERRVRFAHPLYASTVYADADEHERRRIHARLGELAETAEERAGHVALAGLESEAVVATALEEAAEAACRRGARGTGAVLLEQAAALAPAEDLQARDRRLVAAAHAHFQSGDPERARTLLDEIATGAGPLRHVALCDLGTLLDETVGGDACFAAFEGAVESADPTVVARAHRGLAQALAYVGNLDDALGHADAAVASAEPLADRRSLVYALAAQALVRKFAAHPGWRESLDRGLELESMVELHELDSCPSAFDADTRRLVLDLGGARAAYDRMLVRATEHGDVPTEAWCRFGLAATEVASGRWDAAAGHARELRDLAEQTGFLRLPALRTDAHLALLLGDADRARGLLCDVAEEAELQGEVFNLRAALQLEGLLELSLGDAAAAIPPLRRAHELAEQMSVGEPGMLIFLLDEVEALAATGDPGGAAAVLNTFAERAPADSAPWATPLVLRGRGLVQAAERDLDGACASLEAAVAAEQALPLPLERARTRLLLGIVLRRAQRRAAAHAVLTEARGLFEGLGAALWAARAEDELARIGGRAPSRHELTPTERRIAGLVAEGMTNREVAAALFVTAKTVESALTRVYRKLDVRSRTELARRFPELEA